MNTKDLITGLMSCPNTRRYTIGVYPADQLPTFIKNYPAILIANSDVSTEPGTHWLAFYLPSRYGVAEFFDPFGRPPEYYSHYFTDFLRKNCRRWIYNQVPVQLPLSWACGAHCLYFLKLRSVGIKTQDIVTRYYTKNLFENDIRVTLKTHVTYCSPYECNKIQRCIPIMK